MAFFLSPVLNEQQFDANGEPRSGAFITTYLAGTLTAVTTYKTSTGTAHTNPIQLDSSGYYPNGTQLWLQGGFTYKFVITDSDGSNSRTYDNITGIGDELSGVSQWILYGAAPTYISATSFSVVGDQTNTFQIGRRLESINSGGTVYSTITNSAFAAGITTVTVVNDSGVLDAGLSAVSYGLLTPTNPSIPTSAGVRQAIFSNGAAVASAATINLSAIPGMNFHVTGTVATSAITMASGQWAMLTADAAWPLTYNATTNRINTGGVNTTLAASDRVLYYFDGTTVYGQIFRNSGGILTGTPVVGAAQTEIPFTIDPATEQFTVSLVNFSTNGTARPIIQLGDAGGYETTGYVGNVGYRSAAAEALTTCIGLNTTALLFATAVLGGTVTFTLHDAATNTWMYEGLLSITGPGTEFIFISGSKALSAPLTGFRITTLGSDTIDVGSSMNVSQQRPI